MEEGTVVVSFLAVVAGYTLFQMASNFLKRHNEGKDVNGELTAVGEELSRRGYGRDVNLH